MALPHAREARAFYQAAKQRFTDAQFLLEAERTTGAIYLAGYSVECTLKALLLSILPHGKRIEVMTSFHGSKAHDYEWLKSRYFDNGGHQFPKTISRAFWLVNKWAVEIRYKTGTSTYREAQGFLAATEEILIWADGRL